MEGREAVCPLKTPWPHSLAEEARPDDPRQELKCVSKLRPGRALRL